MLSHAKHRTTHFTHVNSNVCTRSTRQRNKTRFTVLDVVVMQNMHHLLLNRVKIPFRQSSVWKRGVETLKILCTRIRAPSTERAPLLSAHHNKSLVIFIIHYFSVENTCIWWRAGFAIAGPSVFCAFAVALRCFTFPSEK